MYTCQEQHGTILQQNLKTLNVDMPRTTRDNPPAKLQALNKYISRTMPDNPPTKGETT